MTDSLRDQLARWWWRCYYSRPAITVSCWWYGVGARVHAIRHLLRGHDLRWRSCPELWAGITGCIHCENCPDTEGRGLSIWCRNNRLLAWAARRLCQLMGHPGWQHPQRFTDGEPVECERDWCCTRCTEWRVDGDTPETARSI